MTVSLKTLAAAALIGSIGSIASAGTVSLVSGTPTIAVAPGSPVGQDFVGDLLGVNANTLYSGPMTLNTPGRVNVTFSLVAAESGFNNALLYNGASVIQENVGNGSVDFATGVLNGQTFTTSFAGGDLASLLSFDINGDGNAEFFSSDDEFGVFADSGNIGSLSTFWLGLDDSGANNDDNHDDIIIRVEVSAVPLPAAGFLFLGGLGGLVAMRRRKKA